MTEHSLEYDKKIFAGNLQRLMSQTETKQSDICNLLGVSKSTVSAWCAAQKIPRMDKIEMLAAHFNVLKSELIEDGSISLDPKKEAPATFIEVEEAYIKMLAEEEGTSVDRLELSDERRRQLRRVILSLLSE